MRGHINYINQKSDLIWDLIKNNPEGKNNLKKNKSYISPFLVNRRLVEKALKIVKVCHRNENLKQGELNDLVKDCLRSKDLPQQTQNSLNKIFSEKIWNELISYSKLTFPLTQDSLDTFRQDVGKTGQKNYFQDDWEVPNLHLCYKIMKYHHLLIEALPQYAKGVDGDHNAWIVKPCYNARGFGIYCIDNCVKEFNLFQNGVSSFQKKSKIVQKYIEAPLLYRGAGESGQRTDNRKFDIRQWVLVTSFDPLKIYMFAEFYLRLCSSSYDLDKLADSYKHLTNFSIQKNNTDNRQTFSNSLDDQKDEDNQGNKQTRKNSEQFKELQMSQDQFLQEICKGDTNLLNKVRQQMSQVVIKTIKSGQESIEHRQNCFEIYGFDFMLDEQFEPWLIEVNLSPACMERTNWLIDMLDRSAEGLFDHIEDKLSKLSDDYNDLLKEYLNNKRKYLENQDNLGGPQAWISIYDQSKSSNFKNYEKSLRVNLRKISPNKKKRINSARVANGNVSQRSSRSSSRLSNHNGTIGGQQPIEIIGKPLNLNVERRVSKMNLVNKAVQMIQKNYRGYRVRKELANDNFIKIVIQIQSHIRVFLAKKIRLGYIKEKKSVLIQCVLRKLIARKKYFQLLAEHIDNLKLMKIKLIQKNIKHFLVKKKVELRHQNNCALKIQKFWRGTRGRIISKGYRKYINHIKIVQQFFTQRFKVKTNNAIQIQKFLKGFLDFQKTKRIQQIRTGNFILFYLQRSHKLTSYFS